MAAPVQEKTSATPMTSRSRPWLSLRAGADEL